MSIKLQNYCFFFFEVYLEDPKMFKKQLSNICNVRLFFFSFLQFDQRYASVQVLFKVFAQICYLVICKEIFAILRTSVSRKTF